MSACSLKTKYEIERGKYVKTIPWFDSLDQAVSYGLRLERRKRGKTDYVEEVSLSPLDFLASISMGLMKTGAIVIIFSAAVWVPQNIIPKQFALEDDASALTMEPDLTEDQIVQAVSSRPIINTNVIVHLPVTLPPPSPPTNLHPFF